MLIYGWVLLVFSVVTMYDAIPAILLDEQNNVLYRILIGSLFGIKLVALYYLSIFIIMHANNFFQNLSFLESLEQKAKKFNISPYDCGAWQNFLQVFGWNPLLWLVPWTGPRARPDGAKTPAHEAPGVVFEAPPDKLILGCKEYEEWYKKKYPDCKKGK